MNKTLSLVITITIMRSLSLFAQTDSVRFQETIGVIARPSADSITLRWAPLTFTVWQKGITDGYSIERYVIARHGKVLREPEKKILTRSPLRPLPEADWESAVNRNRYAAIAAQALYGERFEIDLKQSDVFTIVNKVRENEQRFAFSLFCADMSPEVAQASALWFTDKAVSKEEKYLYRVVVSSSEDLRGSIFVSPDDPYFLPEPKNVKVDVKDQVVSLRWDRTIKGKYTAYVVERSDDGQSYFAISDVALMTLAPNENDESRYEYALDSIADPAQSFFYRLKGLTPFGDEGKPSEPVKMTATPSVSTVPYISEAENIDNQSIRVTWDFPLTENVAIKGFNIERSTAPQGTYTILTLQIPLAPTSRTYLDKTPDLVNYYRVIALGKDGGQYRSPVYLAQLVDSLPPVTPAGLRATIDENGAVKLAWEKNKEQDIFGYRIYKGNTEEEEPSQITTEPVTDNFYHDQVNLNTLTETIYYGVMAIDNNQNHSALSPLLKVNLPDRIKPQPPVLLPVKNGDTGISISWTRSGSLDVLEYQVFRRSPENEEWQKVYALKSTPDDSVYTFKDETSPAQVINHYTVIATDEAGLESEPATPVSGVRIENNLMTAVRWRRSHIQKDQNRVILTWDYDVTGVQSFLIYKATGDGALMMYRSIKADSREFSDTIQPGKSYHYHIMARFARGHKSHLSGSLVIRY
jgi:uncharacterized protein